MNAKRFVTTVSAIAFLIVGGSASAQQVSEDNDGSNVSTVGPRDSFQDNSQDNSQTNVSESIDDHSTTTDDSTDDSFNDNRDQDIYVSVEEDNDSNETSFHESFVSESDSSKKLEDSLNGLSAPVATSSLGAYVSFNAIHDVLDVGGDLTIGEAFHDFTGINAMELNTGANSLQQNSVTISVVSNTGL